MDSTQDKVPTWIGRPVTSTELPFDAATDVHPTPDEFEDTDTIDGVGGVEEAEPTNASRPDIGADGTAIGTLDANDGFASENSSVPSLATNDVSSKGSSLAVLVGVALAVLLLAVIGTLVLSRPGQNENDQVATNAEADSRSIEEPPSEDAAASPDGEGASGTITVTTDVTDAGDGDSQSTGSSAGADTNLPAEFAVPGLTPKTISAHADAAIADGQPAWAIFSDGRIYLQGTLPDDSIAEALTGRLQALLGAGNVIEQYTIEPGAPSPTDPPLFIKETVVFTPRDTEMPPGSDWILVIADVLMTRYQQTDLTVIANGTDSSAGITADLQLERAETIISYLSDRGIDGSRLDYEYRSGSTFGPETGNKPIEFVVRGLLDEVND